jgi:oligopeptidase B
VPSTGPVPSTSPEAPTGLRPPVAERRPSTATVHGEVRVDDLAWLADRDDPAVLAHLEAEEAYTLAATAHLAPWRERLFDEIRSRVLETDLSVPVAKDDWWYYQRTVAGLDYPRHCRCPRDRSPGASAAPPRLDGEAAEPLPGEQVVLDENGLADPGGYLAIGDLAVSPSHRLVAYTVDRRGDERFELRVGRIGHRNPRDDRVLATGVSYGLAWADDDTLFCTRPDAANRPYQLWRYVVTDDDPAAPGGTAGQEPVMVLEEADQRFHLGVSKTKDGRFVLVELHSKVTSEVAVVPTDEPTAPPRTVLPRRPGVEYGVEHLEGTFFVLTNDEAEDFRLMALDVADAGELPPRWRELVANRPGARLDGLEVFEDHLVLAQRLEGSARLRVLPLPRRADGRLNLDHPLPEGWLVPGPDTPSTSWIGANLEVEATTLRFGTSSLVSPTTVADLDLASGAIEIRKRQPVLGDFDPRRYTSARLWATASDGTAVPVSVVRHVDTPVDGTAPCLLYGYGAYEHSIDPVFSAIRLSLLDRGVVFAIAHVRGGGELGRRWYEAGRLEAKPNSFSDFVACGRMLVETGWAAADRLVARGGSAGGLLIGAAVALEPELWRAAVAEVPFVDCLSTMLDPTLPLTVIERDEWGDPAADPEIYRVMRSYAPVDNVRPGQRYPDILATAGWEDPRVGYWEPAKWVQRLRAAHPDNRALLHVDLGAGHGGPSGRYDAWRDEAFVLAWVLEAMDRLDGHGRPAPAPAPID